MIKANSLSVIFGHDKKTVKALNNVDLNIQQGEFTLIKGPSGCGKSTLLFVLGGLLKPDNGTVCYSEQDLYKLSKKDKLLYRSQRSGFVFQSYYLVPYLTIAENIMISKKINRSNPDKEEMLKIASRLNIDHRLDHKPSELSVGEKQRASLARVLYTRPEIIFADEPTGNLDPQNAEQVLKNLSEFKDNGGTIVMVTHGNDADVYATRNIQMEQGKIISQ